MDVGMLKLYEDLNNRIDGNDVVVDVDIDDVVVIVVDFIVPCQRSTEAFQQLLVDLPQIVNF